MNPDFTGKVVLVTGASAGIGEATALLFAKLGAQLALVGRNAENLRSVAVRCAEEKGLQPLEILTDLSTDEGAEKTAKDTVEHFGRLDVLVNNAAEGSRSFIQGAEMEVFDRMVRTNLRAVYNLTRLLVPELVKTKGNIINVSSVAATNAYPGNLAYSITKAALDHFSRIIAVELAPKGVRVNTVSPGITVSKFVQRVTGASDEQYQAWLTAVSTGIPLKRACTADDVAYAIVHLASDHSAIVTGALLVVDGGVQFTDASHLVEKQKLLRQ
ncbi:unnamed protein product [Chilo suppressalis]|uniref:Ketoreductase domain-containing protein n=1 Tax=Chilo suppressalis TaxID=168631 RepID=A0ABN8BAB3_CHISP|nr:unnamed protein product [Chilo suppressalis]